MTHIGHSEKVFDMKRLLIILILTLSFQTLTKADDIRDFEIEGMSIGDSLLDFYDENQIIQKLNTTKQYYDDNKFIPQSRPFSPLIHIPEDHWENVESQKKPPFLNRLIMYAKRVLYSTRGYRIIVFFWKFRDLFSTKGLYNSAVFIIKKIIKKIF